MKVLSFYLHTGNSIAAHRDNYNFIRAIMDVSVLVLISQYYYKQRPVDDKMAKKKQKTKKNTYT